ncbi:MAG: penicillin-binding transpeptidase domain-containing protein [Ruminococcus flavefaciens]|nr:penicillin-binding transpeptidase domain-containing protein [Ruminococcus flavefaciens]
MILNRKCLALLVAFTAMTSCSETPPHTVSAPENVTLSPDVLPATEETEEETTEEVTTQPETEPAPVTRGNIYDINGNLLVSSEYTPNNIEMRVYNEEYAVSLANILTEMSDGYDRCFEDILRTPSGDSEIGNSIQITIDSDVQNALYNYMAENNLVGSVVVMRTDGSILSQVSYPSYDPTEIPIQDYDEKLAWGECGNKAFQNAEPGSCFKIMSEVIADKHGIYSLWDEGEWTDDGATIVNWDHDTNSYYPMERSLYSAFTNSSNIFFAKAFNEIGKDDVLEDLDSIFHFVTDIECDFGKIENNIEINCNDDLRRSAFGQSYILTCPIYLATLAREAVFGDMVRPFVLENIVSTGNPDTVIEKGSQPNEVIASIPEEYRQNLLDGMAGVASGLGTYLPENFTLYAKTGTAETWVGDFLYITGCLKNSVDTDGSYIVVMQIQNPQDHGLSFASESAYFYQGIINTLLNAEA